MLSLPKPISAKPLLRIAGRNAPRSRGPSPDASTTTPRRPALAARTRILLEGPILATLLRLALPNLGEAAARISFVAVDAVFVGWLGTEALAGVSLAFPIFLIMQMMSASGLGAGVSSAIARALGAGRATTPMRWRRMPSCWPPPAPPASRR
jgi:hypothetical protein